MIKEFTVTKSRYYKQALVLINCFLGLTDYELKIITAMFIYDIKLLNTVSRVFLREKLETNIPTFNNYVKRLKDKHALVETVDGLIVSNNIINALEDKQVSITFNITD